MKKIRVIFSPDAEEVYKYLNADASDSEIEVIAFILDIVGHKEYDKKFSYKGN